MFWWVHLINVIAYLTNEILGANNNFNVIHNCYEFYMAIDYCYDVKPM